MPEFGKISNEKISECHADLQLILNTAIRIIDFSVIEGWRGEEEQNKFFKTGLSKSQWPDSKHNSSPSMGADVVPYPIILRGRNVWKKENHGRFAYLAGIIQTVAYSLYWQNKTTHLIRWGGDFDNDTDISNDRFLDLGHIELYTVH